MCRLFRLRLLVLVSALVAVGVPFVVPGAAAADLESYAVVREDASLIVRGRVIYLFGIFIPDDSQFCQGIIRPATCGTRAAVALDQKIQKFVRCRPIQRFDDRTITAQCWTNYSKFSAGEDLAAWLLRQGLAVATPEAPYEYHALERIALANGRGVWGFQVDGFPQPRFPRFR